MRTTLPLALVAALATPALAGEYNEISVGSQVRVPNSDSAAAVAHDVMGGGTIQYARKVDLDVLPRVETSLTGRFGWAFGAGELFQTMQTDVSTIDFAVGARARYALHPKLRAGVRLDAGLARTGLSLYSNGVTVSDAGWAPAADAAILLDWFARLRPGYSFGFRVELGHQLMVAPSLAPRAERDDSMIFLEQQQASIGSLDLGGSYFSFSMINQF